MCCRKKLVYRIKKKTKGKQSGSVFPALLLQNSTFRVSHAQYVFLALQGNKYWASSTPATRAHTLALATALTLAMAAWSMDGASCASRSGEEVAGWLGPRMLRPRDQHRRPAPRRPRPASEESPTHERRERRKAWEGRGLRPRRGREAGLPQSPRLRNCPRTEKGSRINSLSLC